MEGYCTGYSYVTYVRVVTTPRFSHENAGYGNSNPCHGTAGGVALHYYPGVSVVRNGFCCGPWFLARAAQGYRVVGRSVPRRQPCRACAWEPWSPNMASCCEAVATGSTGYSRAYVQYRSTLRTGPSARISSHSNPCLAQNSGLTTAGVVAPSQIIHSLVPLRMLACVEVIRLHLALVLLDQLHLTSSSSSFF